MLKCEYRNHGWPTQETTLDKTEATNLERQYDWY